MISDICSGTLSHVLEVSPPRDVIGAVHAGSRPAALLQWRDGALRVAGKTRTEPKHLTGTDDCTVDVFWKFPTATS
jgi:hypothetical protein